MNEDSELLRRYAEHGTEAAFAELVNRRIGLVYAVALRQVGGDAHLAEDVSQRVFTDLARKAATLASRPVLSGWLYSSAQFAASDIVRGERRRKAREERYHMMSQIQIGAGEESADWSRLRPVIDEAMAELDHEDRDAVALRFLEGKAFAEIGRRLSLSEDTARKRVERALDRLHAGLSRRGVTSTMQALALALAGQAAAEVPAGLAASVTNGALAGAAGVFGAGLIHAVISSKATLAAACLTAAAAAGLAVVERREASEARDALALARGERESLAAKLASVTQERDAQARRAEAADADAAQLLDAVQRAQSPAKAPLSPEDEMKARYRRAQEAARAGRWEEALPEFLWCYNEGMPRVPSYSGVRNSFLLSDIMRMTEKYPPAGEALRHLRDRVFARLQGNTLALGAAQDYAALNDALGESARTLALFDSLPKGDRRRVALATLYVQKSLIEARRYDDVLSVNPHDRMVSFFGTLTRPIDSTSESAKAIRRRSVVASGAANVEVLAGVGDLAKAKEFAGRVLAYDNSPETLLTLKRHLERAGQPGLLDAP